MAVSKFMHSYLFSAVVTKWQTNGKYGWKRVLDSTNGTTFLLNTNRCNSIRVLSAGVSTSLYYFDNPFDQRCNQEYMEMNVPIATFITAINSTPTHSYMTLPIFPITDTYRLGDPTGTTTDTVIPIENFSFAEAVPDSYYASQSIVYYVNASNKFKRARVNLTLVQLLALIV